MKTLGMFKRIAVLVTVLCVALAIAVICTVGGTRSDKTSVSNAPRSENAFTADGMREELAAFMEERSDRTPFSDGEKAAGEYIFDRMSALEGFTTEKEEIEYYPYADNTETVYYSNNIVSIRKSANKGAKTVIIGANYDNQYGKFSVPAATRYGYGVTSQTVLEATHSSGAYVSGTSTATLLALAERLERENVELDFDLYVVFFGCGELWNTGASTFVSNYSTNAQLGRTVLMINLQRLGGDNTYLYSDEVRTDHADYIFGKATGEGIALSEIPATLPRMPAEYIDGIVYAHAGMFGASSEFAKKNIPCANIFGGTFDTFSLGLEETKGESTLAYTPNDNIEYLDEHLPSYADKMADVANLVYSCFTSDDFIASIENTKNTARDYSILMTSWIPSLIAIGVILLCAAALLLAARLCEKRYPPAPPVVRKIKVAVFGMDYEDPSSGDIFVDVKSKDNNSPFSDY